jgi:hypothetical protein
MLFFNHLKYPSTKPIASNLLNRLNDFLNEKHFKKKLIVLLLFVRKCTEDHARNRTFNIKNSSYNSAKSLTWQVFNQGRQVISHEQFAILHKLKRRASVLTLV